MKCSKCGADFPDDAKFCPYCGRRVSVPTKGKGEAEGGKELTLGLVKLLGSALGVSVLLNMKLLLEQDGEPSKATEKVEDMLRSADLYGEKEEAAVKEAEEFCREMNSQVSDAVSEAVGSVTGNLEKAFTGIGKVVGKVASEFEKAVAKAEPEEKAEEAAEAAEKVTGEAAEEVAGAAEEFAAAVDKAMADVEKTLGEIFEKNEAPVSSAEEDADEEIPISDADETKETPSWFVMSDATGQELLEEELYSNELAGERVSPAEPEAPAEEAESESIPVEISEEAEDIPVGISEESEDIPVETSEETEDIPVDTAELEEIPAEPEKAEPESISIDIFAEPDKEPWPIGITDAEPAPESTEIGITFEDDSDEEAGDEEDEETDEEAGDEEDEETDEADADEEAEDEESDDEEDEEESEDDEADDELPEDGEADDELPEGGEEPELPVDEDEKPELPVDEDEKPEEDFLFNNLFGDEHPEAAEAAENLQDAVDEFLDEIPENNAAAIDELLSFGREDGAEKQPAQFREDPVLFDIFHKADEKLFEEPKEEDIHINTPEEEHYDVDDDADDIFSQRIPDDENGGPEEIIIEEPDATEPERITFDIFANGGAPEPAKKFDEYDCEDEPDEVDFPIEF